MTTTSLLDLDPRTCRLCGKILKGRTDKVFCNKLCHNSYNNHLRSQMNKRIGAIDKVLKRNHRILLQLIEVKNLTEITQAALLRLGFDFMFHTHHQIDRSGITWWFCYEFGYGKSEDASMIYLKRSKEGSLFPFVPTPMDE